MFERNRDSLWSVATSKFGFELALANVGASEVSAALDAVRKPRLDALLVELVAGGSGEWYVPKVIEYAERHRLPAVYPASTAAAAGGLLSFGADLVDDIRRGADQLARILKGANAAETPIDQATRFELVVKLRTAGALGLKIPQSILVRADRVIE
jgi:putative ABC transport system substrate-binding protein